MVLLLFISKCGRKLDDPAQDLDLLAVGRHQHAAELGVARGRGRGPAAPRRAPGRSPGGSPRRPPGPPAAGRPSAAAAPPGARWPPPRSRARRPPGRGRKRPPSRPRASITGLGAGICTVRTREGDGPLQRTAPRPITTVAAAARAQGRHPPAAHDQDRSRATRRAIPGHRSRGGVRDRGRAAACASSWRSRRSRSRQRAQERRCASTSDAAPAGKSTVHPVVETFVELVARHDPSASLSSLRARKSCAFDVPVARFNIAAISS